MSGDLVTRMRALCSAGWHKGDELRDALAAGADEIERLTRELERVQAAQSPMPSPPSSDLTAVARREAGPVTPHQWRQCSTCGRCFWLAPTEAVPAHRVAVLGVERACGWAVTAGVVDEGSEGR